MVDARGKYLIPGLWDMHTHIWSYPDINYSLFIVNGVTGIRDVGTGIPLDSLREWRSQAVAGTRVAPPRQLFAGPMLNEYVEQAGSDTGAGACRHAFYFHNRCPSLEIRGPDHARRAVDSLNAAGADFIKVHTFVRSPELYYAIVAEAKRVGIPFAGHLPGDGTSTEWLLAASDSGQRTVEHVQEVLYNVCTGEEASVAKCRPVAEHLARNGTWTVLGPAFSTGVVTLREAFARYRYWPDSMTRHITLPPESTLDEVGPPIGDNVGVAEQAGLPMLVGTDFAPGWHIIPGFGLHDALAAYVDDGLTPLAALQAVTLNPAKSLGATDSLGTVAVGKLADLVLLDGNPLADIRNMTKIRAVVANGRYFGRATLDSLLSDLERKGSPRFAQPR